METPLVLRAALRAITNSETKATKRIHHSDRGSQYTSELFRDFLVGEDIQQSMSRKGNCYDNAMMESFWATLSTLRLNASTTSVMGFQIADKKRANESSVTLNSSTIQNAYIQLWITAHLSTLRLNTSKRRKHLRFLCPLNQGKFIVIEAASTLRAAIENNWNSMASDAA